MPEMTVDEFVATNVAPALQEVAQAVRRLMATHAPQAVEGFSYGMPTYTHRSIIAWMTAAKTHITFSFTLGVQFDDPHHVLKGSGKHARGVRLKRVEDIDEPVLAGFIAQALAVEDA